MSYDPLHTAAQRLASLPPHQNPAKNGGNYSHISKASQPLARAVMSSPMHAAVAAGGGASVGSAPALNPKVDMSRQQGVRHQIVAFQQVNLASATPAQVSATPYQRFKASRMIIAPMTISGGTDTGSSVTNWQVGTSPQFASLDGEPVSSFAASNNAAFLDFDLCPPAIAISATVKVAASITFWGCLVGSAPDSAPQPRPMRTKVARLPIKSTAIAPGSTTVVTATPTVDFWGRKIVLADAGTNQFGDTFNVTAGANGASGLLLQQIYVANAPQFLSAPNTTANQYIPCSLFMGLYDLWLDLDKASVAVPYTFQVYNPGTVTLNFAGVIEGDIAC